MDIETFILDMWYENQNLPPEFEPWNPLKRAVK